MTAIEEALRAKGYKPTPNKRKRKGPPDLRYDWTALFQCGKSFEDLEVMYERVCRDYEDSLGAIEQQVRRVLKTIGLKTRRRK